MLTPSVTNLGRADRVMRTYVTAALILGVIAGSLAPVYALVSVIIAMTAIVAWDPFYALFGINSIGDQEVKENGIWEPNMGQSDRAVRFSLAMTAIVLGLLATNGQMTLVSSLLFLAPVALMATAITAWDPMYALIKKIRPEVQADIVNFTKLTVGKIDLHHHEDVKKAA